MERSGCSDGAVPEPELAEKDGAVMTSISFAIHSASTIIAYMDGACSERCELSIP